MLVMKVKMLNEFLSIARFGNNERLMRWGERRPHGYFPPNIQNARRLQMNYIFLLQ